MDVNITSYTHILVSAPSKNLTCHQAPLDLLKKIKKTVVKKKPKPIFSALCSAVSALFMHCMSLTRGRSPRNRNRAAALTKPPDKDGALAREK
jgi:hypothetical protein